MTGHRRYKRFTVDVMNIKGKITLSSRVHVVDINKEGAKLKADLRLNIGSEYVLHMESDEKSLKLKGTIEWSSISEPVEGTDGDIIPMYTAGLKFNDVAGETLPILHFFVQAFNTEEEEKLSKLGFQVLKKDNAPMNQSQDYKVKKISLGGMLIGSVSDFEIDSGFPMEISLPGDKIIQLIGRIASCIPVKENDSFPYDIGIEFMEMSDQHKDIIRQFLKKLETGDEEEIDMWLRHKNN